MNKMLTKLIVVAGVAVVFGGQANAQVIRSDAANAGACSGAHIAWSQVQRNNPNYANSVQFSSTISTVLNNTYRGQPDYVAYQARAINIVKQTLATKGPKAANADILDLGTLCSEIGFQTIQLDRM